MGFTLVLTSPEDKEKVAKLPIFESSAPEEAAGAEEEEAAVPAGKGKGGKRKAEPAPKAAAKGKKAK